MTSESREASLAPDDAFGLLGNQIRMEILHTLGSEAEPVSFSALREAVGVRDSGQFNYHLEKLTDHFIAKTESGYTLRQPGQRVIQAVLSGAITEDPVLERTPTELPCFYCGTPIDVSYRDGEVRMHCGDCPQTDAAESDTDNSVPPEQQELLGFVRLPPAGIVDRSAEEVLESAYTWYYNQVLTMADGVCPRCSAALDHPVTACDDHDFSEGYCEQCGHRSAARITYRCPNCSFERELGFSNHFLNNPDLQRFALDHGVEVVSPSFERVYASVGSNETEVISTDPFEARITYEVSDASLTLTVDGELSVTGITRN
ncbi:MAG: winged helix-turn-helix domain-containing protein [Halobacteriales archaeon]